MKDNVYYKYNKVIDAETKYIRLLEAIDEAQNNFLNAQRKGETFCAGIIRQSKFFSKWWEK